MTNQLFLHVLTPPEADVLQVSWRMPASAMGHGVGTLEDFSKTYHESFKDEEILVIVSGLYVTYINVEVTVKNQKQMLQALPFLVEEYVIGDIEDMHIAIPDRFSGESVRIAIMDNRLFDKLNDNFSRHGLIINAMYGMPDMLAVRDDELHILLSENFSLVKSRDQCFQSDSENIETMLDLIPKDGLSNVIISLHEKDSDSLSRAKKIKTRFSKDSINVESSIFVEDVLDYMPNQFNAQGSLNLLQGIASSSNAANQKIREFAPVAWVAMLCLILQIGFNFSSGFYFSLDSDRIEKELTQQYLKLFTEDKTVVNIESQLMGKINAYNLNPDSSDFTTVFSSTVAVITKVGAADDIHLKQFRYDEESGELKMGLDARSVELLDKIKKNLAEAQMAVEIISANEENGLIKATLSIKHV